MYGKVNNNRVAMKWNFFFSSPPRPANGVGVSPVFSLFPPVLFPGLNSSSLKNYKYIFLKNKRNGEAKGGEKERQVVPASQLLTARLLEMLWVAVGKRGEHL